MNMFEKSRELADKVIEANRHIGVPLYQEFNAKQREVSLDLFKTAERLHADLQYAEGYQQEAFIVEMLKLVEALAGEMPDDGSWASATDIAIITSTVNQMFKITRLYRTATPEAVEEEVKPEAPPEIADGGSTPSQYALPVTAEELQDLIEYREMNFAMGNIFKACYRDKVQEEELYDINKILWFALREKKRIIKNRNK